MSRSIATGESRSIAFKKLTKQSIRDIHERILNEKLKVEINDSEKKQNDNNIEENSSSRKTSKNKHEKQGPILEPNKDFIVGNNLPNRYHHLFPENFYGVPIEEIDPYWKNKYVCVVVNKNKQIFRFNTKNAIFILNPLNKLRRLAILILTHPILSAIVMLTILMNCVAMAMPPEKVPEFVEIIFTVIYTFEAIIKILARGFILDEFSFLRDAWNWLDFIVITLAYATSFIKELGNLSVLRTLRVLRALKTVAIVPGLKTIVDALIQSVVRLRDVSILTGFILSVFALIGSQLYMGILKRKCVWDSPNNNMTALEFFQFTNNSNNWVLDSANNYILCGNSSGAGQCPYNSTCLPNIGKNPNNGYTNFDSYPYAMLCAFRLMTQDYWENLYLLILTADGPFQVIYFIGVIFFGSFYLVNLILAIVAMSYQEQQQKAIEEAEKEEERRKEELEETFNPGNTLKKLTTHLDYNISVSLNSLNNVTEPIENSPLPKLEFDEAFNENESVLSLHEFKYNGSRRCNRSGSECIWEHKRQFLKIPYIDEVSVTDGCNFHRSSVRSNITNKTNRQSASILVPNNENISCSNDKISIVDETSIKITNKNCKVMSKNIIYTLCCSWDCIPHYSKIQKIVAYFILDAFMDLFIYICIVLNTLFLALDQHNPNPTLFYVLSVGNYVFTSIFAAEAFLKIIALSPTKYLENKWNIFDIIIVSISLAELFITVSAMSALRSFRLLRVFKLAKSWPTFNRLMQIIAKTLGALGNLTFVLGIIIFIFAVMGNQLFGEYYVKNLHLWGGELPRWNFVDFFHSFLIVFRVLCGEWIESMWVCIDVAGWPCIPFFLLTMVVGSLVVLNLFLVLLLSSFSADNLKNEDQEDEINQIPIAINRIKRFFFYIKDFFINFFKKNILKIESSTGSEINATNTDKINNDDINLNMENIDVQKKMVTEKVDIQKFQTNGKDDKPYFKNKTMRKKITYIWVTLKKKSFITVEHKYFEIFIILMIVLSSIALATEDKNIYSRPKLKEFLEICDNIFTFVFTMEVILKLLAYGSRKYFTDGWSCLDFAIVFVALLGIVSALLGADDIPIFKLMRTLRALRPLRALSRFDGIRVVVGALLGAIPSIFNVLMVCLVFWLIFCIMGVQLFAGKFYKCVDINQQPVPYSTIQNKHQCLELKNLTNEFDWVNSRINFDNVMNAYLALLQVATFKGWIEIMADAADISQMEGEQPRREQSMHMLIYFVVFIIFGSFFTLNLFIGVIIDNFNQQKKILGGNSLEMFMTEEQKKYYNAMKKMGKKKPIKAFPRPKFYIFRLLFDITSNQKFDIFIMVCIILNMIAMCAESYDQSEQTNAVLQLINNVFVLIFTAECVMKLLALHWRYFKIAWNVFDFIIVLLSIFGMAFDQFMQNMLSMPPTVLRVVRVIRVGRVLRLVKGARGIRTLLFALAISLPALVNIGLLLFLVIFIYAIFGMNFFMYVRYDAGINELFNFENIFKSMITLFPLCTSAGWSGVLEAITNDKPPHCDPTKETHSQISQGDCGNQSVAIAFLVSYLIISYLVVINMYIAVILENFTQAREEVQQGLTDDDYDMYYELWQKYDPHGSEFLCYDDLTEFVHALEEPLGIKKPNRLKLISMNLVICKGNMVHCSDILDALTKNFLGTNETIEQAVPLEDLKKGKPHNYEPIGTTLQLQHQQYSALKITRGFRNYLIKVKQRKEEIEREANRTATINDLNLTPIHSPITTPAEIRKEFVNSNETFL